ncbi:MAG: bacillithiol biosynthesis deacetylase BshB1 [Planctomycetota bacterium]
MTEAVDLLVIAAHPDDAELTLGGTLLVAKELGHRTGVLDLTRGELSSRGDLTTRAEETEAATRILRLDQRENLDLPDGGVRDTQEMRERLVSVLRRFRPRVILAPWKEDRHPDHAGAGRLAERTFYLSTVGKFAPGEDPYLPQLLGFYICHTPFLPSAIVDVSAVWEQRSKAARVYASQYHQPGVAGPETRISNPGFLKALEGRARHYGMMVGVEFGEPIRWEYPALLSDPVGFLARERGGP